MAIDRTGDYWRGETFEDLAEYVRAHKAGGYEVAHVEESVCADCEGRAFTIMVDDEDGCAQRTCLACGNAALIADSADFWDESEPGECACPCGGETFACAL